MAAKPGFASPYKPRSVANGAKSSLAAGRLAAPNLVGTAGKATATIKNPAKPGFTPAAKPGLGAAPDKTAPAAPAAPVGQHAQPDSLYNTQVDLADRQGTARLGQLDSAEASVKNDFGIEDPTNPFSRANALKKMYLARMKGVSAALAAQGQLYGGAHERAIERTRSQEEQARAELRSAYDAALGSISNQRTSSQFQTEADKNKAFEDWLARAPEADVVAPADSAAPSGATAAQLQAPGTPQAAPSNPSDRQLLPVYAGSVGGSGSYGSPGPVKGVARPGVTARPKPVVQSPHRVVTPAPKQKVKRR